MIYEREYRARGRLYLFAKLCSDLRLLDNKIHKVHFTPGFLYYTKMN